MRIVFEYGLVGDEDNALTATAWVGDLIRAERKFGMSTEEILNSGSLEKIGFILHSRLTHLAKRDEGPAVPPFDVFVSSGDVGSLAWCEPTEATGNPSRPASGS